MKIRNKLTFLFTILFAGLLVVCFLFIYLSSAQTRKEQYYKRLYQQAITKANLLLDAKVAPNVLQLIYKNSPNTLYQEEVAIYDTAFQLLYHDAVDIDKVKETKSMIDEIVSKKEIKFGQGDLQVVGLFYQHNGQPYVITAAAQDDYGLTKLKDLKFNLLFTFLALILLTLVAGRFFARKALQPVAEMVDKVEEITATNLDSRVPVQNEKDEIGELAITFNHMLDRLENSFEAQKQFVSNISHELRTPLSSMVTEKELALLKDRSVAEYKHVIQLDLEDTKKLVKLSNGLLDLAKASYDPSAIGRKEVRLDELLLDAMEGVLKSNPDYKVNIIFEKEIENDDFISVHGNEYLLKVAFINLIENSCKFSNEHRSLVAISYFGDKAILRFDDTGVGIDADDLPHIFQSFYRGSNKQFADGNGIGLSLTQKIILLHKGSISVTSRKGEGTSFSIEIPHIG